MWKFVSSTPSWGASSCAFFSLYLQNCHLSPNLRWCWFLRSVKSPVCSLHLLNSSASSLLRDKTTSDAREVQVWMCPLSPCLPLAQAHRVHHLGACWLCVLRGGPGHSSMASRFEHYHQELTAWCRTCSDWWKLLSWFQIAPNQNLRTEGTCFLQVHVVLLPSASRFTASKR